MKYFTIEYIKDGQRHHTIIRSFHKIEAIKDFQSKMLGVMVSAEEIDEPL